MISKNPVNAWIMDVDKFVKANMLVPVKSHQVYEASTTRLHPEGLYSEEIFGEIGTTTRLSRFSYIDLNTEILHPIIYTTLVELRGLYKDIMSGREYVRFDQSINDFVVCSKTDPEAETGYQYFMEMFDKIVFRPTKSAKRNDKIRLLDKYKDILKINKCIVSPAGIRDIETTDDGRVSSEEINDIYQSVLSLSLSIPKEMSDHPIFNSVRFNLQMKVNAIVDYIFEITGGKRGYNQGKYMARKIAYGNRNVFVSAIVEGSTPDDPRYLKHDETYTSLFQAIKLYELTMRYHLRLLFFNSVFNNNSNKVALIDPETGNLVYTEVTDIERNKFMTDDGLEDYIGDFKNKEIRFNPVTIQDVNKKKYYIAMVKDEEDSIFLFKDKADLDAYAEKQNAINLSKVKHLDALDDLGLSTDDYIILGSVAAIVHGFNKQGGNSDIDIMITPEAFERIKDKLVATQTGYTDKATGTVDCSTKSAFYDSQGDAFAHSIIVDGYRVLSIQGLLRFYEVMYATYKLPKHVQVLKWIREYSESIYKENIRPLTIYELMYITAYACSQGSSQKYLLNTRYPVAHVESIYPSKCHIVTTSPSRLVQLKSLIDNNLEFQLPHYPILGKKSNDALALHPSWLENLTADFDGDMGNATGLMTEDATAEIESFMNSPSSIVNPRGELVSGVHDDTMVPWVLFNMSRDRIQKPLDISRFNPSLNNVIGMKEFVDKMPVSQVIVVGSSFLALLGLTKNYDIDCIASEYIFNIIGTSDSFVYDHKKNEYHSPNSLISVFPSFGEYSFDQIVSTAVRFDSVLFVHPKIQYEFYKRRNAPKDAQRIALYEKYFKKEIR